MPSWLTVLIQRKCPKLGAANDEIATPHTTDASRREALSFMGVLAEEQAELYTTRPFDLPGLQIENGNHAKMPQGVSTVSPPFRVPIARQIIVSMSPIARTEPSIIATCTTEGW